MADCSATGTALDRVISRTITSSVEATGTLKNLVGNVGTASSLRQVMPIQAPDTLRLPETTVQTNMALMSPPVSNTTVQSNSSIYNMPMDTRSNLSSLSPMVSSHLTMNHHQMMVHPMAAHPMQAMQQQMQMQMQIQAQMQAMSIQYQNRLVLQQRDRQEPLNSSKLDVDTNGKVNASETATITNQQFEHTWHEGIEDEWDRLAEQQVEWKKLAEQQVGHEGLVEGASIDQLAQAWAEAEEAW